MRGSEQASQSFLDVLASQAFIDNCFNHCWQFLCCVATMVQWGPPDLDRKEQRREGPDDQGCIEIVVVTRSVKHDDLLAHIGSKVLSSLTTLGTRQVGQVGYLGAGGC